MYCTFKRYHCVLLPVNWFFFTFLHCGYICTGDKTETIAQSNENSSNNKDLNKPKHKSDLDVGKKGDSDKDSTSSDISTIEVVSPPCKLQFYLPQPYPMPPRCPVCHVGGMQFAIDCCDLYKNIKIAHISFWKL